MPYDNSVPPQKKRNVVKHSNSKSRVICLAADFCSFGHDREGGYGEDLSFEPTGTWRHSTDDSTDLLVHSFSHAGPLTEALNFTSDGICIAPRGEGSSIIDETTPHLSTSTRPQTTLVPKAVQDACDREDE